MKKKVLFFSDIFLFCCTDALHTISSCFQVPCQMDKGGFWDEDSVPGAMLWQSKCDISPSPIVRLLGVLGFYPFSQSEGPADASSR